MSFSFSLLPTSTTVKPDNATATDTGMNVNDEEWQASDVKIYEKPSKAPSTKDAINIIVNKCFDSSRVTTSMPKRIREQALLIVDLSCLKEKGQNIETDSDENGAWCDYSKPNRSYTLSAGKILPADADSPVESVVTVHRAYKTHKHTKTFRCQTITVTSPTKGMFNTAIVYYYFSDNIEVPIKLLPHGNCKKSDSVPYFKTDGVVKSELRKELQDTGVRDAVDNVFLNTGSVFDYKDVSALPRNTKQARNIKYYDVKRSGKQQCARQPIKHQFYDLMEMVNEGDFLRDMSFGTLAGKHTDRSCPRTFAASKQQLHDVDRFCSSDVPVQYRSVLGVDGVFNCGDFYATVFAYKNPLVVNIETGNHLLQVGPICCHTSKSEEDYLYLMQQLEVHAKLHNKREFIPAVGGTDGEIAIENAMLATFKQKNPAFIHLQCEIHVRDNVIRHCEKELKLPKDTYSIFLKDIFGVVDGGSKIWGLVDARSEHELDEQAQAFCQKWDAIDERFSKYFKKNLYERIKKSMMASVRIAAGLGDPPVAYTQNGNECVNNLLKHKNSYTKQEWTSFLQKVKELVLQQERTFERACLGLGDYTLSQEFAHHRIDPLRWSNMTRKQQEIYLQKMKVTKLDRMLRPTMPTLFDDSPTLGTTNIERMMEASKSIIEKLNGVVPYPGDISGIHWLVRGMSTSIDPPKSTNTLPETYKVEMHDNGKLRFFVIIKKGVPDLLMVYLRMEKSFFS